MMVDIKMQLKDLAVYYFLQPVRCNGLLISQDRTSRSLIWANA